MYCGQCGKKVMENMLFCPFCGSPIVIPEQDASIPEPAPVEEAAPVEERAFEAPAAPEEEIAETEEAEQEAFVPLEGARPVSLFADEDEQVKPAPDRKAFVPLSFSFEQQLQEAQEAEAAEIKAEAEEDPPVKDEKPGPEVNIPKAVMDELTRRPARRPAQELRRPQNRVASTYIPIKEIDPDDMFMDRFDDDEDDYDMDEAPSRARYDDEFDFEEPEQGGFFQRHIRGIVGLLLLLVMAAICAAWAFSPKGQESLAKVNLAWTAKPYAEMGYEAYNRGSHLQAARYYEKALSLEQDNYEHAHSAMVAYYDAYEIESAAEMLKKCIEMDPKNPTPYQEMLILYPDPVTRPWEISELIRLGYQRTGDATLNVG